MSSRNRGDDFDDLAEAVERGALTVDRHRVRRDRIERELAGLPERDIPDRPDRGGDAFDDLAEAVQRGALAGDGKLPRLEAQTIMRERYTVEFGPWKRMRADLLGQLLADAGSIRLLALMIDVPRSTLNVWYARLGSPRR